MTNYPTVRNLIIGIWLLELGLFRHSGFGVAGGDRTLDLQGHNLTP